MANLFEKLAQGRPAPSSPPLPTYKVQALPAQRLLNFLQRWPKDTITLVEIVTYGPRTLRYRTGAMIAAETLAQHGWLIPFEANQRLRRQEWQIVRSRTLFPDVTSNTAHSNANS